MRVREHGTASMYNAGCRCRDCTKANSARAWAKRAAAAWDGSVADALGGIDLTISGRSVMVPAEAVRRAVEGMENAIKVEALASVRSGHAGCFG